MRPGQALAQANFDKMLGFKSAGAGLEFPTVPQEPTCIAQLRKNLERGKPPPGFKIDVFAIVPAARHMGISKSIGVVFTGARKSLEWAVTDCDRYRTAEYYEAQPVCK